MPPLMWDSRPDGLRAPALVCAFKGWNDAGDAASAAVQFVGASHNATRFALIDPEDFYDFQATRPRIKLTEGRTRELAWPSVEIYEARVPRAPRDLVLRASGRAGRAARPRRPALRRAPRARRRGGGRAGRPARSPLGRRHRARVPALPAPAGSRGQVGAVRPGARRAARGDRDGCA